jgi:hypothetical protein
MSKPIVRRLILLMVSFGLFAGAVHGQTVTLLDGRTTPYERLPMIERFRGTLPVPSRGGTGVGNSIVVWATPAFCPSSVWYTHAEARTDEQLEAGCTAKAGSYLEDYPAQTRERCKCVRVMEGTRTTLKALSDIVNDPYAYTTITLVVSRQNSREKLRGFVGRDAAGAYRIFNEKGRLVCAPTDPAGADRTAFTCFDGRVSAKGTYRVISASTSTGKSYGLGTFQLSDGSQLDMAIGIADRDLFALHPDFPK